MARDIKELVPKSRQQEIIDGCVREVNMILRADYARGRGAGKSTMRGFIAQAILDSDGDPLYKVVPVQEDGWAAKAYKISNG